MKNKLITLSKELLKFETTPKNYTAINHCFSYIEKQLSAYPLIVKKFHHHNSTSIVWLTSDTLTPDILLNGHIDVVPAPSNMFKLSQDEHKLYGRGVADMKCAVASFIVAIQEIYQQQKTPPVSIGIMLTSDEETGGTNGVNYLVNQIGFNPKVVFIPDGGENNNIISMSKGVLHLSLTVAGKTAHASDLWEGDNAIDKITSILQLIRKKYPQPQKPIWKTTLNIGQIKGGQQTNQVPDLAEALIDIRYIPSDSPPSIIANLQTISPSLKINEIIHASPFKANIKSPYIKQWMNLINQSKFSKENGASDARYFNSRKTSVILSSPNFGNTHADGEWIEINSLISYTQNLINFITTFNQKWST
jgi:succinyl-diaminopimelate desuccinylase